MQQEPETMTFNKTFPENISTPSFDVTPFGSTISMTSNKSKKDYWDCSQRGSPCCCSRQCCWISVVVMLILGIIVAAVACAVVFGIRKTIPESRFCITANNHSGFLCDNSVICLQPSQVCHRIKDCLDVANKEPAMCSDLPHNLPSYLVFRCGDPSSWVYTDQVCNGFNNCGDCSDESGPLSDCPPCGPQYWNCESVVSQYCNCIPRQLCRDNIQHCVDWSDEYNCAAN
ncbi:low-density lipoprotein receptor class A domain-containing protein 1-like isoform X2 [Scyliorhinus torazame]|uniref:low-density lipoprotein receptor class A domain-containing protein 1-like isoform X2 n=1 Tax=Scyliorhinus torazame TaxID=75743 RepID=UPI003B5BCFEC